MHFEAVLTPRRCCCLIVLASLSFCWIVSVLLTDMSEEIVYTHQLHNSVSTDVRPGESPDHLHWFVQISDLHLSKYHDKTRPEDLLNFCTIDLGIIRPEVILLTGDITDAKSEDREGSFQMEEEWIMYENVMRQSKILERTVWLDTRGNHDAFDVPSLQSRENYFNIYSSRGKLEKLSYHYLHQTSDGDSVSFIAVDACLDPGPKRPFNFFGILSQSELDHLEDLISQARSSNQTIFFGHYPSSIISSPRPGVTRQLLKNGIAYLCGHMHTLGGLLPNMYAIQKTGYLELELADWKDQRYYRLMALDHGLFSFVDLAYNQWPVVLVTNPKNAKYLVPDHEPTSRLSKSTHIRILAFSKGEIESVKITIDGVEFGEAKHVKGPLYVRKWDPLKYNDGLHNLEVHVVDSKGLEANVVQQFSLDDTRPSFGLFSRYILMLDHTIIFMMMFFLSFVVAVLPLVVIKIVHIHLRLMVQSIVSGCFVRFLQCWLRRYYLLCQTPNIFYPLMFYNIYIATGPWFIGEILSNQIGACFVYGLFVSGIHIPGSLTYFYGALHLWFFNIPLTLYLGRCLDLSVGNDNEKKMVCRSLYWPVRWLFDHGWFFVLIGFQVYLVLTGFFRSYGTMALLICPMRTWAVFLAIYLRRNALGRKSSHPDTR